MNPIQTKCVSAERQIEYLFYRGGFSIKVLWSERPKPIQDYTWLKERPRKRAENGKWLKGRY
jgi:hypothetical protein